MLKSININTRKCAMPQATDSSIVIVRTLPLQNSVLPSRIKNEKKTIGIY